MPEVNAAAFRCHKRAALLHGALVIQSLDARRAAICRLAIIE